MWRILLLCLPALIASGVEASTITTSRFIIEYDGVSEHYARTVLESAQRNLPEISRALGSEPAGKITIVLAATDKRFRELTNGELPDWSAAVAMPERRIVFSPLAGQKLDMEKILAHELVHIVIDDAAGENPVPRWFHEGCAELFSGEWNFRNELYMAWKVTRGDIMDFDDIQDVFSRGNLNAGLAYDESMLALRFLVSEHGRRAITLVLTGMSAGKNFPEAFLDATSLLPTQFEDAYIRFLHERYGFGSIIVLVPSTWTFIMALFLAVYIVKRRRAKRKLAEWEREEAVILSKLDAENAEEDDGEEGDNIIPFEPRTRGRSEDEEDDEL